MNTELVKSGSENGDQFEEYERLLFLKEKVKKEAAAYDHEFLRLFGSLLIEQFQTEIEVIRTKKEIALYRQALNCGKIPDPETIEQRLNEIMKAYDQEFEAFRLDAQAAQRSRLVSPEEYREIRRIYHKYARKIHPDLHPELNGNPRIKSLWQNLQAEYQCNSLEGLKETAFLIDQYLNDHGENIETVIDRLDEKIEKVRASIQEIMTTDPYLYGTWIDQPKKIDEQKARFQNSIQALKDYHHSLERALEQMIADEVYLQ